ncbi:uncharacterized protein LOC106476187 [Limulus polyphemus]|uniref:Uncharacterized protein LOC106476187 n=1 Tax=Limulus polyphemus TaxID=6850 RepID=A0ABM1C0X7_LIMPO|nr:uncharacterized protein LOC106476187 [Limulus polyphemus]
MTMKNITLDHGTRIPSALSKKTMQLLKEQVRNAILPLLRNFTVYGNVGCYRVLKEVRKRALYRHLGAFSIEIEHYRILPYTRTSPYHIKGWSKYIRALTKIFSCKSYRRTLNKNE